MVVPAVPVAGLTALGGALTAGGAYLASRRKPSPTAASPTPSPTPGARDAGGSQNVAAALDAITPESEPWRAPECAIDEVDGELILSVPNADPLLVNRTAALVWSLCDGKATVAEITARLEEAYPEAEDRIGSDVATALAQLLAAQAILVA